MNHQSHSIDVTNLGSSFMQAIDSGVRSVVITQQVRGKAALAMMHRHMDRTNGIHYRVKGTTLSYYEKWQSTMGTNRMLCADRRISLSFHEGNLDAFTVYGIAHFLDHRIPYVERRLTYKRAKGWKITHKPYHMRMRAARKLREAEDRAMRLRDQQALADWDDGYWDDYDDTGDGDGE